MQPSASIQRELIFSFDFDAIDVGVTATYKEVAICKSLLSLANQRAVNKSKHSTGLLSNQYLGPPECIQVMKFIKHVFIFVFLFSFDSFEFHLLHINFNQFNQNYTYFDTFVSYIFKFLMVMKNLL